MNCYSCNTPLIFTQNKNKEFSFYKRKCKCLYQNYIFYKNNIYSYDFDIRLDKTIYRIDANINDNKTILFNDHGIPMLQTTFVPIELTKSCLINLLKKLLKLSNFQ